MEKSEEWRDGKGRRWKEVGREVERGGGGAGGKKVEGDELGGK